MAKPGLSVSPSKIAIATAKGSVASVKINCSDSWKATSDQSWLTISSSKGTGSGALTITATANTISSSRTAAITISVLGAQSQTIIVTQFAGDDKISVAKIDKEDFTNYPNPTSSSFTINSDTEVKVQIF